MPAIRIDDPILKRFRAELDALYGKRIERVVLFRSRTRGDARDDSDYDSAIFLHDLADYWREADRIADIGTIILYDTGAVINGLIFPAGAYRERTVFMNEVRLDGLDLWARKSPIASTERARIWRKRGIFSTFCTIATRRHGLSTSPDSTPLRRWCLLGVEGLRRRIPDCEAPLPSL